MTSQQTINDLQYQKTPLTILFDIEATVDTPKKLPQLFIDLANELNDIKEKEKTC